MGSRSVPTGRSSCSGCSAPASACAPWRASSWTSIPIAGWVVKGGVAYTGTRAIGRAAVEYFERGAPADVTRLRTLAEHLRS